MVHDNTCLHKSRVVKRQLQDRKRSTNTDQKNCGRSKEEYTQERGVGIQENQIQGPEGVGKS